MEKEVRHLREKNRRRIEQHEFEHDEDSFIVRALKK